MQHHKKNMDDEYVVSYQEKQAKIFSNELKHQLAKHQDENELFDEELKQVQINAIHGKLHPENKEILIQWKTVFPERFDHFCDQLTEINRKKLDHFLH